VADATLRALERRALAGDRDAQAQLLVELARANGPACKTPYRLMTPDEVAMAKALGECSFPVASWDKRFGRELGAQARLFPPWVTAAQAEHLRRMVKRYRRQIPKAVVALAAAPYEETLPKPQTLRRARRRAPGACATCWEPFGRHTAMCAAHPDNAARRARDALGMFAPPEAPRG
jgi:hypothetical protein